MVHIAFATTTELGKVLTDEKLLESAFQYCGFEVSHVPWNDDLVQWRTYDAVLLRTTWNYHLQPNKFARWLAKLDTLGVPIINSANLVRWNMHKGYLIALEKLGIPIVETLLIAKGGSVDLARVVEERGWTELVAKPAISATAYNTRRIAAPEDHQSFVDQLLRDDDVLLQPFIPEIQTDGELSVLYFGGTYSHSVVKRAKGEDFRVQSQFGGTATAVTLEAGIRQQTDTIVGKIEGPCLYARVDGVVRDGIFLLMELELIEPQLFIEEAPQSAALFARAFQAYAQSQQPV